MIIGSNGYVGSALKLHCTRYTDIYLAFMSNNDMCMRNPELAEQLNEESFARFLTDFNGNKIIFASSVAAYGDCLDASEDTPLQPTTAYGRAKKACEEMLKSSGFDYTIVRSASVCGVSPKMRYDLMVNRMVRDAAKTGLITVNGGAQMRSHVHIDDLCLFYEWVLDNPDKTSRETFNVVSENQSVVDTATLVAKTIGKTEIRIMPATDNRSYTVSGEKAKAAGFECTHRLRDAIVSVYLETLYG